MWAGEFVKPWDWRRGKRLAANDNAPDQCRIKGNINRKSERIYHVPGQQAYGGTRINPPTGEQWFCSENDASSWMAEGTTMIPNLNMHRVAWSMGSSHSSAPSMDLPPGTNPSIIGRDNFLSGLKVRDEGARTC